MIAPYNPIRDGSKLDKIRHTNAKAERLLRGVGSRAKQYEILVKEGMMGVTPMATEKKFHRSVGTARQLNISMSEETYNKFARLQGRMSRAKFIEELCNTYEHPPTIPDEQRLTPECAAIISHEQKKYGLQNGYDTLNRLVQMAESAQTRAARIRVLEGERDKAVSDWNAVAEQLSTLKAESMKPVATAAQAKPEAEEVLFDFTNIFTGATATADPSGQVIVQIAPEKLSAMFDIWRRAVGVLGFSGKEK